MLKRSRQSLGKALASAIVPCCRFRPGNGQIGPIASWGRLRPTKGRPRPNSRACFDEMLAGFGPGRGEGWLGPQGAYFTPLRARCVAQLSSRTPRWPLRVCAAPSTERRASRGMVASFGAPLEDPTRLALGSLPYRSGCQRGLRAMGPQESTPWRGLHQFSSTSTPGMCCSCRRQKPILAQNPTNLSNLHRATRRRICSWGPITRRPFSGSDLWERPERDGVLEVMFRRDLTPRSATTSCAICDVA